MATLFMLMGLPGSGKSTLARRLESAQAAVVLTPDVWMARIVGDGYDAPRREAVKALQADLAERLLTVGCNVVMDSGFFSRRERDAARALAHRVGAVARLIFLDVAFEELWRRIEARNAELPPDTFAIPRAHLELCAGWFERPDPDETLWMFPG